MAHYKIKKLNLGGALWRNETSKTRNKKRISKTPYSPLPKLDSFQNSGFNSNVTEELALPITNLRFYNILTMCSELSIN
jgi:hypothetical protein